MVFVLTHQLAIAAVEHDDAALGVVEAEAVSHVIERSVQLGRFFACKCFGALTDRQQLLPLGHVLVRGYPPPLSSGSLAMRTSRPFLAGLMTLSTLPSTRLSATRLKTSS